MKNKTKMTIVVNQEKILKGLSRETAFERYGGGQFVSMNRPHRNKKKYDRKREKASARKADAFLLIPSESSESTVLFYVVI